MKGPVHKKDIYQLVYKDFLNLCRRDTMLALCIWVILSMFSFDFGISIRQNTLGLSQPFRFSSRSSTYLPVCFNVFRKSFFKLLKKMLPQTLESVGLALGDLVLGDAAVEHVPGELIRVLPVVNQIDDLHGHLDVAPVGELLHRVELRHERVQALEEGELGRGAEGGDVEVELVEQAQGLLDRARHLRQVLLRGVLGTVADSATLYAVTGCGGGGGGGGVRGGAVHGESRGER